VLLVIPSSTVLLEKPPPPHLVTQILRVNINYRIHSSPLPVIIPSYINPVDAFPSFVFKIHFNIILSLTSLSANLFLSLRFPQGNSVCICVFPYTCLMLRPFHSYGINPLNPELNPICYLLALLGAHHFLHVSRIRVKLLTFRLLMSYIYGAPILDVSRSHTTTQHSR